MIRILIIAAALAFLSPMAMAADKVCTTTYADIVSSGLRMGVTIFKGSDKATGKIIGVLNENRAKAGKYTVEADTFIYGVFMTGNGPKVRAIALLDKCVVAESVQDFSLVEWLGWLKEWGLTPEDFVQIKEVTGDMGLLQDDGIKRVNI